LPLGVRVRKLEKEKVKGLENEKIHSDAQRKQQDTLRADDKNRTRKCSRKEDVTRKHKFGLDAGPPNVKKLNRERCGDMKKKKKMEEKADFKS